MKGVIIYKGKYGATRQYAVWLGEALQLEVFSADKISGDQLGKYDFLIIGASVYIGKLQIKKWLFKNTSFIRDKQIFLFQVAATPAEETEKRQEYNRSGIPQEIINSCEFYFLPGKMIMKNLSWKDRFMLRMGARLTKDPEARKTMLTDYDDISKENIAGMVTAVKKFTQLSHQRAAAVPPATVQQFG